jgi:predicted negative regulator of RcsB-dependent stress response
MAYDLEEQEQLASLKAWWENYGNFILTLVTLVLLAFAAWNGWRWYQRNDAAQAAPLYDQLVKAAEPKAPADGKGADQKAAAPADLAKARELAGTLMEKHHRSVYATMAALQMARLNYEAGDLAAARAQLAWVIDKSGHPEFVPVARVRLAGVLLDEKNYDEALKVLSTDVPPSFAVAVADRRGDVLLAQNKVDEARNAWRDALARADAQHPLRNLIQLKLDALPPSAAS